MLTSYRWGALEEPLARRLCRRNPMTDESARSLCREIFEAVRSRGDAALRDYSLRFDGVWIEDLRVSPEESREALEAVGSDAMQALRRAASNLETFHRSQVRPEEVVAVEEGIECWRETRPIQAVGLYVPGGSAVLPSTALMLGVPARLAGCPRVALCVPPRRDGSVAPEVLAAASIAGVNEVYRLGGAQAIAALALGTESVRPVDKIFGPGSHLVQTAKLTALWSGCQIDMVAGPSEVLVIADAAAVPELVAADLLSQAEHGADSQVVLVSTSEALVQRVGSELTSRLALLPRRELARLALEGSFALLVPSLAEAFEFSNRYAPEHLILHVRRPRSWIGSVKAAGSVFVGPWSPEVAGDYASGANHALPTGGSARAASGVSVESFVNRITFQELQPNGLRNLASTLVELARMERLEGHADAVLARTALLDGGRDLEIARPAMEEGE